MPPRYPNRRACGLKPREVEVNFLEPNEPDVVHEETEVASEGIYMGKKTVGRC